MYLLNIWTQRGDTVTNLFFETKKEALETMKEDYENVLDIFKNNSHNIYLKKRKDNHAMIETCEDVYFWQIEKVS